MKDDDEREPCPICGSPLNPGFTQPFRVDEFGNQWFACGTCYQIHLQVLGEKRKAMTTLEEAMTARLAALARGITTTMGVARRLKAAGCFGPRETGQRCPLQVWLISDPAIAALLPEDGRITVGPLQAFAFYGKVDDITKRLTQIRADLPTLLRDFLLEFDVDHKFDFLLPPTE